MPLPLRIPWLRRMLVWTIVVGTIAISASLIASRGAYSSPLPAVDSSSAMSPGPDFATGWFSTGLEKFVRRLPVSDFGGY